MYDRKLQILQFKLEVGVSEKLNAELENLARENGPDSFIQIIGQSTYVDVMSPSATPMLVLTVEVHEWEDVATQGGVSLPDGSMQALENALNEAFASVDVADPALNDTPDES